ncbi:PTS sugar transporter subunit IIC [Desemzia sp. RIT804]|uniref:PTS sugar transporter subunit IIC n=1 Tax=Desemzia sp. RIT 804 TaxID=2810209 RepID=UPI00194FCB8B|nr:PTS transporter subunit EIIC [Desemzia sp. RIT 804]MBM6614478.1 PTS sugar transporter subunit IIC [Desemzia sp. RIT 804]
MNDSPEKVSFLDRFAMFAAKLGNQIHLRSLRDAFAVLMPLFILAGLAVLVNNVLFPWFFEDSTLTSAQMWGNTITNGTLNIAGLSIAPMIAYNLSKNKDFPNPIAAAAVAISALVIMMPTTVFVTPVGTENTVEVSGVLTYGNLGTTGMFAGIIIGLLATEIFIQLSSIKRLQINLGENVPPQVGKSFSTMIPVILVLSLFGIVGLILSVFFQTDLITLISTLIQEPLRAINTSLLGTVLIYSTGNFLFTLGIHQTVINGSLLDPFLLTNMNENMLAYANGAEIPHIINSSFISTFALIGGTGSTITLLIAIFLFGKQKESKDLAKLAVAPGLFNINEPVIFGYPIVFNLPMMIPFVLVPAVSIVIAYFATALGLMNPTVVYTPWTTPPLISAYLATAGDWRAVVVQLVIIVVGILLYIPFMKISERAARITAEKQQQEAA